MSKINQYPLTATQINDEDFYDVDYWNGVEFESRKISGLTLKSILQNNIYNSDGTLTGNRSFNFGAFDMAFLDSNNDTLMQFFANPLAHRVEIGDESSGTPLTQTILEVKGRAQVFGVDINKDITPDLIKFLESGFSLNLQMQTLTDNRIQTFQDKTGIIALLDDIPLEKLIASIDAENLTPAGAGTTWNGVPNIGSPTQSTLNQGFKFLTFPVAGQPDGAYFNGIIPTFYQIGNTLKISFVWTSQDAGDCVWDLGLTSPTTSGTFGGDVQTEWESNAYTSTGSFTIEKVSFTFSGLNFSIGDPFSVKIFRNKGDIKDTLTGDAFLNSITIEQS